MQRLARWLDLATFVRMDYREHCTTCGVTITAGTSRELMRLVYEHESMHLDLDGDLPAGWATEDETTV